MKSKFQNDIFQDIIGKEEVKYQIRSALAAGRHIILVGPPGCGKTTFAKDVARALEEYNFVRVQGSPDLTAEDLLGDIDPMKALEFGPLSKEAFTKGKIFKADKGVLFFDEVNRCPQKIQNALLQVLQEKFATIGSYDVDFPVDFVFIGTMNPEDSSTEKLSSVFLDRFDIIDVGYPDTNNDEVQIVNNFANKIEGIAFPEKLLEHSVHYVRSLRDSDKLSRVPSVRATLGLYERSQSNAYIDGRDTVSQDDVSKAIESVLAHRIELKPSVKYLMKPEQFVKEEFDKYMNTKGVAQEDNSDVG